MDQPTALEIARRQGFLSFDHAERQLLVALRPAFHAIHEDFIDTFYTHLRRFAVPRKLLADERGARVSRS